MGSPTNLTEQISKLREREGGFLPDQGVHLPSPQTQTPRQHPERKAATDYFMLFAYGLFAAAIAAQLMLIVWLDLF